MRRRGSAAVAIVVLQPTEAPPPLWVIMTKGGKFEVVEIHPFFSPTLVSKSVIVSN